MIESLVLFFVVSHFILFVVNFYKRDWTISVYLAVMFFAIAIMVMQIQIPYVVIDSTDTVTTDYIIHSDFGTNVIFILLGIINAFLTLVYRSDEIEKRNE
jgi:hypothetical protein